MSLESRRIALVEDDPVMGGSLVQRLSLEGASVDWWQTGEDALEGVAERAPEIVICDLRLPGIDGEEVFRKVSNAAGAPPFLFITGFAEIDQAVRLMRAGAGDYVAKPFGIDDFLDRVQALIGPEAGRREGEPVLGVSKPMRGLEQLAGRAARIGSSLLVTGETGTGKEVVARLVHGLSPAADQPFMAVNCAAIPSDLMESELFGHEKGAFTGAHQRHAGYAERAAGGTLFLDEVGELRPDLQAKLLRLLEERRFTRVGGERPVEFRARVIAATNADLEGLVRAGRFRADLYYRINVVAVPVPPLRERRDDIPWLMERFFSGFAATFDSAVKGISSLAEEAALAHDWPGNVRELRNRVERAVALSAGPWIGPGDLFPEQGPAANLASALPPLEEARDEAERRHILRALAATGGGTAAAARILGIGRTTLWEKMGRLGLKRGDG
ncbi:sigma-54-dependent transcriptional regulator [Propylenella binzhouense]|uniref:Sigma-54-dependent Fis family transcriptional regulator n=1 Tax=Propylenella binzhouense TaxID=2555902 RepID=A0A964T7J8_9HYPH|nr:sigma-54 dependent transcriptional regulator [Propylenella binzhouense]MYZ49988.1 sigma-54-dependent Fis family transcriptional regulator [Propylenella binzhouense]